jgi:ADP-heptose:LPS heptosyltransferase
VRRPSYSGPRVMATQSKTVLETMCNMTGTDYAKADYRLSVPDSWNSILSEALGPLPARASEKPWLIVRPLVARHEWRGGAQRNADPAAYAAILDAIRDQFFVISVADLEEGKEWLVGPPAKADLSFHAGELVFEALASLFKQADLVLTSSGFGVILASAVETPCISVVGGYEDPHCHDSAARFAPYLVIGPRVPCSCWTSMCRQRCDKSIDLDAAIPRVRDFVSQNCPQAAEKS